MFLLPPKKTAPEGLAQLKQALKQGDVGNLYVFHGKEDYLRDHYLTRLRRKLVEPGMEAFNYRLFQGKELEEQVLSEAVESLPMMSERTMVEVWDWDLFKNEQRRERLLALVEDLPEYVCLVFVYDTMEFKANANTRLGKLLRQRGLTVEFEAQSQSDLNQWIRRRLEKRWGKEMDTPTAEYLTFLCGGLMTNLAGELDKAGAYAKGPKVTKADLDAVCDPVLDARVFQMTDALLAGSYDRSAELLSRLLRMGESGVMLLAALSRQFRQLWSARLALEHHKGDGYLSELWNLKSGWQLRKLQQTARNHSLDWCRRAVSLTMEADWQMKLGGDEAAILTMLMLSLAVPAGREQP